MFYWAFLYILLYSNGSRGKSQHWSCGAGRWQDSCSSRLGEVAWRSRTSSLPFSPSFASFPESCMLTWTEPGCEQFGGVIFGGREEGEVSSWVLLDFKPYGTFSPPWESTCMNCRKPWGPLERCLSVGFTVKVKICFRGAVLSDKCILWVGYEWVARWNFDWDFVTIVSIILSFLMKIFFIMANNVVLPVTMFLMSRKTLYILHQTLLNL